MDRANVISLKQVNFLALKNIGREKVKDIPLFNMSFSKYNSMVNNSETIELTDRELTFLSDIHENMNSLNRNVGIGFRILTQIDAYIKNIPNGVGVNRREGLDIQLAQRILPKIRGTKEQWGQFIGEYDVYEESRTDAKNLQSELIDILNKYSDVSDFEASRKYILNKARELSIYGYTL